MANFNSSQLKTSNNNINNVFIGPVSVKNAPKSFGNKDYKKAMKYDYDNDGVVDYNDVYLDEVLKSKVQEATPGYSMDDQNFYDWAKRWDVSRRDDYTGEITFYNEQTTPYIEKVNELGYELDQLKVEQEYLSLIDKQVNGEFGNYNFSQMIQKSNGTVIPLYAGNEGNDRVFSSEGIDMTDVKLIREKFKSPDGREPMMLLCVENGTCYAIINKPDGTSIKMDYSQFQQYVKSMNISINNIIGVKTEELDQAKQELQKAGEQLQKKSYNVKVQEATPGYSMDEQFFYEWSKQWNPERQDDYVNDDSSYLKHGRINKYVTDMNSYQEMIKQHTQKINGMGYALEFLKAEQEYLSLIDKQVNGEFGNYNFSQIMMKANGTVIPIYAGNSSIEGNDRVFSSEGIDMTDSKQIREKFKSPDGREPRMLLCVENGTCYAIINKPDGTSIKMDYSQFQQYVKSMHISINNIVSKEQEKLDTERQELHDKRMNPLLKKVDLYTESDDYKAFYNDENNLNLTLGMNSSKVSKYLETHSQAKLINVSDLDAEQVGIMQSKYGAKGYEFLLSIGVICSDMSPADDFDMKQLYRQEDKILIDGNKIIGKVNTSSITYFTEEEKKKLAYLAKVDYNLATVYYETIKQDLNKRKGFTRAMNFVSQHNFDEEGIGEILASHFKALGLGSEQSLHGLMVTLLHNVSADVTAEQYEAMYILALLDQKGARISEKVFQLSMSEGNMLPAILAGGFGSLVGVPHLGAYTMFLSVAGNAAETSYQQGHDEWTSWAYGMMQGASEATLEYFLGGIPGISKMENLGFLGRIFNEGIEESLQEILDPYMKYLAYGETPVVDWNQVVEAGIDGMILAAYLNGGSVITNMGTSISNEILEKNYEKIKTLEEQGVEIDYARLGEEGYLKSLNNLNGSNNKVIVNDLKSAIYYHDLIYGQGSAYRCIMAFLDPTSGRYGDYTLISSNQGARDILKKYSKQQIRTVMSDIYHQSMGYSITYQINNKGYMTYFDTYNNGNDNYGVDQGHMYGEYFWKYEGHSYSERQIQDMIKNGWQFDYNKIEKKATLEYYRLKNKLISQGFTKHAASVLISGVDQAGACSYADVCNGIFAHFANNPDAFKKAFGYDMYIKDENGKTILNSGELLIDLYSYINMNVNGGSMFVKYNDGTISYNPDALNSSFDAFGRVLINSENQIYMSSSRGLNVRLIQQFLNSKGSGIVVNSSIIASNRINRYKTISRFKYRSQEKYMSTIIGTINDSLNRGLNVSMGIYQDASHPIRMELIDDNGKVIDVVSTLSWSEGGGHAVFITALDPRGFVVSSWGKKYIIPYEDIQNGGPSTIYSWSLK